MAAAERFYRAALRLDPGDPQTLCLLGRLAGSALCDAAAFTAALRRIGAAAAAAGW